MRVQRLPKRLFLITFCLAIISLSISFQVTHSQTEPLSLAQVLTGLQSKSGGFTLAQKNTFITDQVRKKGVTFKLTPELERELRIAGATPTLIRAIRLKSLRKDPTPGPVSANTAKPDATFDKIWVEQNVVEEGVKGIRIYANFNVYNLKDVKSDIVYRFQKDGKFLSGTLKGYKTVGGQVSARRFLAPAYDRTVYEELAAFLPYKAFNLPSGVHNLKLDADVIKRDGTQVKHLTLQDLRLVIPSPSIKRPVANGSATLRRFWVDYDVRQDGKLGMIVHVNMVVNNMQGQTSYLRVLFTKNNGTPLRGLSPKYRTKGGQTALFRRLNPGNPTSSYSDIAMFIPYDEFGLSKGTYVLKMRTDVISDTYKVISNLNNKTFSYTRR